MDAGPARGPRRGSLIASPTLSLGAGGSPSQWSPDMTHPNDTSSAGGVAAAAGVNPVEGSAVYPIGSRINELGHLEVGGRDVVELAAEFDSGLHLRRGRHLLPRPLLPRRVPLAHPRVRGPTASKAAPSPPSSECSPRRAFRSTWPRRRAQSGAEGRLRAASDPHARNNKTDAELRLAAEAEVGYLILDSFDEIRRAAAVRSPQDVLIRVNVPGSSQRRTDT